MIIQSRSIVNDIKKSGLEYNHLFYPATPGFNIYTIVDHKIIQKNFGRMEEIVLYIKQLLKSGVGHIIGLVDFSIPEKFASREMMDNLTELGLKKIKDLAPRIAYYFLFDVQNKKLIGEKIGEFLVADTYENMVRVLNRYIVCANLHYLYFGEYFESLREKLCLIIMPYFEKYHYLDDPNELYIFPAINYNRKKCHKKFINFEQLSRPDIIKAYSALMKNNVPLIDYSIENLQHYKHAIHLPYQYYDEEINRLSHYYQTLPKLYDVAFCGRSSPRRNNIIKMLKNMGLKVFIIKSWGDKRDRMIASCKILINIHCEDDYKIYESLRCDRWAFARMPVISEDNASPQNNLLDVKKYHLVYFYPYSNLATETSKLIKIYKNIQPSVSDIETVKNIRAKIFNIIINNQLGRTN